MSKLKKVLLGIGAALLALIVLLAISKEVADARYFNDYDPNLPFNERVKAVEERTDEANQVTYQRVEFSFESTPGERIPTLLTFPEEHKGELPAIIFLHGIGQKKTFLDRITAPFNKHGFAMACFDQYMQGERKVKGGPLAQAMAFRARPRKTINETRRLIDYLEGHPDIDEERIYLVGASYGAITGSTVIAFDERIRAGILIYGGANIRILLDAPMIRREAGDFWVNLLKPVVAYIMDPADPEHYASGNSPRPVFLQAGDHDTLVHPPAAQRLIDTVGEPKKVQWYNSDHIGMLKEERHVVEEVLEDALEWLLQQDAEFREEPVPKKVEVNAEV